MINEDVLADIEINLVKVPVNIERQVVSGMRMPMATAASTGTLQALVMNSIIRGVTRGRGLVATQQATQQSRQLSVRRPRVEAFRPSEFKNIEDAGDALRRLTVEQHRAAQGNQTLMRNWEQNTIRRLGALQMERVKRGEISIQDIVPHRKPPITHQPHPQLGLQQTALTPRTGITAPRQYKYNILPGQTRTRGLSDTDQIPMDEIRPRTTTRIVPQRDPTTRIVPQRDATTRIVPQRDATTRIQGTIRKSPFDETTQRISSEQLKKQEMIQTSRIKQTGRFQNRQGFAPISALERTTQRRQWKKVQERIIREEQEKPRRTGFGPRTDGSDNDIRFREGK